jgi:hypothetical protein
MSLIGDGPAVVALLDQAEFLQPPAQRQRDRSAFGNPAQGYLFLVGKLGLLETTGRDFHRGPFWQLFPARLGEHEAKTEHSKSTGQWTAAVLKAQLPSLRQVPFAQSLLDQTKACEDAIHRRQDLSLVRDIAKRLHLRTIRDEWERNGLTCHLAAGLAVPVCQFGKHKACADETDHGQHLPILRSPSSAANGRQQITPTSRFSSAVRAEAVQAHRSGGKKENPSNCHEMEGDKRDRLAQATDGCSTMPWLVVRCKRCTMEL